MKLLGFHVPWTKDFASGPVDRVPDRGWWPLIQEPFTGAWQHGQSQRVENIATYGAVYACVTLVAQDISKVRIRLVQQDANQIWSEVTTPSPYSAVLRKPNRYQNRIKFFEAWVVSKLIHGNAYILKERENRGIVTGLYVLDPLRTRPLVAPDGSVFYQLSRDNLAGVLEDQLTVPASEIIHDVMVPLFHPLCGVSPLTACGLAAVQGMKIQENSTRFFANGSQPGGILTAPGLINDDTAKRLKAHWEQNYSGANVGRVAVLGDGLKYEGMSTNPVDAQLIEQLKWSDEKICSCFHVPSYMVGIGAMPHYNNIEALNQQYYTQCLQGLIENIELCLDEGLGLPDVPGRSYGTEFDLDDLLRMDSATKIEAAAKATGAGIMKLDEARAKFDLPPMEGGDAAYLQQQNFSVAALAKRDALDDPFGAKTPAAPPATPAAPAAPAAPPPAKSLHEEQDLFDDADLILAAWELKSQLGLLTA